MNGPLPPSLRHALQMTLAIVVMLPGTALAQQQPADEAAPPDTVLVEAGEGSGHTGRLAVNIAAGAGNQQVSNAILAQGDVAVTRGQVIQAGLAGEGDRRTSILVQDQAFAGNSGLISLNISAGSHNQSANMATLAIGQSGALVDQFLAQTRAPIERSGGTAATSVERNDSVAISDDAFGEGSGLFQANLIAGERNSSANTFSLSVSAGGQP